MRADQSTMPNPQKSRKKPAKKAKSKKHRGSSIDSVLFKVLDLPTVRGTDFCPNCASMVKSRRKGYLRVCSSCGSRID
jgi:NADH pyrophosphatase NudC (nudix superfamily)